MAEEPERITDFSAVDAARLAMVSASVFLPPATELTILVPTELMTEETALLAAFSTAFFLAAASLLFFFAAAAVSASCFPRHGFRFPLFGK